MEPGRQYFTKSCQTITTCATITDINILSVFTITITDRIHLSVFTVMPPSPTDYLSVITIENTEGFILSIIFTRRKKNCPASPSVRPSVFRRWLFFLFPTESETEQGITDD
jgi:hypothetical protein